MYSIMIVDDDPNIREVMSVLLASEGYSVTEAASGQACLDLLETGQNFDLIVLDIMMPDMSGIEVCRRIRLKGPVPVLFVTAKSQDRDKVEAYTIGGDDFLVKPFSQTELLMKIKSLIRRHKEYDRPQEVKKNSSSQVLTENIIVDIRTRSVKKNGQWINLTDKEFDILRYFMEHRGEVVRNQDLYEKVWGEPYMSSAGNTIMVHVLNLRKKLEDDINKPEIIKTVWGKGYRID